MSSTTTAVEERVQYEDVDDIIDVAARTMEESADYLSVEELNEVAADLDIPREYVEPAIAEVRRRRKAKLELEAQAKKRLRYIAFGVGTAVLLLLLWSFMAGQSLRSEYTQVERRRSQVTNVLERQVATENRWRGKPDSADKTAELSGAENRVRIERKRYDGVAAQYNDAASSFPASLLRGLMGSPESAPMSAEIVDW